MSHSLNFLRGIYLGKSYRGVRIIGVIQGDTRTIAHMTRLNLAAAWRPHVSGFPGESAEFHRLQAEIHTPALQNNLMADHSIL